MRSPIDTKWKFKYSARVSDNSLNLDPGGPTTNIFLAYNIINNTFRLLQFIDEILDWIIWFLYD
jgi:hypothetical protein